MTAVEARVAGVHRLEAAPPSVVVTAEGASVARAERGIDAPVRRPDGEAKVTGAARYAGEEMPPGPLHAVMVTPPVARGRVRGIDPAPAPAAEGVVRVLTRDDMPSLGEASVPPLAQSLLPMTGDEIAYEGQLLALVLVETPEQARGSWGSTSSARSPPSSRPPSPGPRGRRTTATPSPRSTPLTATSRRGSLRPPPRWRPSTWHPRGTTT